MEQGFIIATTTGVEPGQAYQCISFEEEKKFGLGVGDGDFSRYVYLPRSE